MCCPCVPPTTRTSSRKPRSLLVNSSPPPSPFLSFYLSFCCPKQITFFNSAPPPPPQVCTVKSCCKGGNPNWQEQEICVNEEVRSGNGCSTLHWQTKDTVQQPAASFRLWGPAAPGPGTPIILNMCMSPDQIRNQRHDKHVKL